MSMCQMMMTNAMFNFPFIISIIPASPACGVYISLFIRYYKACVQYSDFLDRAQLPSQTRLIQGYVVSRLKSSLQKFYGRRHNRVDRYEIFISQMTMNHLPFKQMFSFLYHCQNFYRSWVSYSRFAITRVIVLESSYLFLTDGMYTSGYITQERHITYK